MECLGLTANSTGVLRGCPEKQQTLVEIATLKSLSTPPNK